MKRIAIEECRIALGLSHEEAAKAIGISRPFYTQIENGTRDPSVRVARKIADIYGLTLEDIFFIKNVAPHNKNCSLTVTSNLCK